MTFVWDERKNRSNQRKHGVSTATRVFGDPAAVSYPDRHVASEERWHTVGLAGGIAVLLVFKRARNRMAKKKSVSSRQEKRVPASVLFTTPISETERRKLKRLADQPDSKIDYSDAPDSHAVPPELYVGRFYRPIKQLVSLRVDADVLAWYRARGKGYQTHMNEALRRAMQGNPPGR